MYLMSFQVRIPGGVLRMARTRCGKKGLSGRRVFERYGVKKNVAVAGDDIDTAKGGGGGKRRPFQVCNQRYRLAGFQETCTRYKRVVAAA